MCIMSEVEKVYIFVLLYKLQCIDFWGNRQETYNVCLTKVWSGTFDLKREKVGRWQDGLYDIWGQ